MLPQQHLRMRVGAGQVPAHTRVGSCWLHHKQEAGQQLLHMLVVELLEQLLLLHSMGVQAPGLF